MNKIDCIIFDLGGVIIDLDVAATIKALSNLSGSALSQQQVMKAYHTYPAFQLFEKGLMEEKAFRDEMRTLLGVVVPDKEIDIAWNAMLVGLPQSKLEMMKRLMKKYTIIILSNTNSIHIDDVNTRLLPPITTATSLHAFAHYVYFSHEIKLRKPDAEIYEYVLDKNKLNASSTIFLDDNQFNIEAASAIGIQTKLVNHPDEVFEWAEGMMI